MFFYLQMNVFNICEVCCDVSSVSLSVTHILLLNRRSYLKTYWAVN